MAGDSKPTIWIGTRKGAFCLRTESAGGARRDFALAGPWFLGAEIYHVVQDPRDPASLLMAAKTGHLGPTVYRSADFGESWTEASRPPQFEKAPESEAGPAVNRVFWLEPGHSGESRTWWAGIDIVGPKDPGALGTWPCHVALFRSEDAGATWEEEPGLRRYLSALPDASERLGFAPGGAMLHSIRVDPRDTRHLYVSASGGGTFESLDRGRTWKPLNKGVATAFLPEGEHEYGQDPHCLVIHPADPDRLYQQNHCGIYRLDRPADRWERIGDNMPREVGDIGFPIVVHARDRDTAWVIPMDGGTVWPRTSPGGRPAVYRTRDAGRSWERQDSGLPAGNAWWTVLRQSMAADDLDPVGLYFGTTSGEVWGSADEGASWRLLARNLPVIQSITVARRS